MIGNFQNHLCQGQKLLYGTLLRFHPVVQHRETLKFIEILVGKRNTNLNLTSFFVHSSSDETKNQELVR